MARRTLGDFHINLQSPLSHIQWSQFQQGMVKEIIQQFGPTQIVLFEPLGEIGTPKQGVLVIKQSIKELWHLTYFTDFIIVHGVQHAQCCNLWGCWIQTTYTINTASPWNHVRTNECVQHGLNVAGPGWDGTSTSGQSRDWELNQWHPRGIKQDQEVVTNIALRKYEPRPSHKTWSIVLCNLNSINKAYCLF